MTPAEQDPTDASAAAALGAEQAKKRRLAAGARAEELSTMEHPGSAVPRAVKRAEEAGRAADDSFDRAIVAHLHAAKTHEDAAQAHGRLAAAAERNGDSDTAARHLVAAAKAKETAWRAVQEAADAERVHDH